MTVNELCRPFDFEIDERAEGLFARYCDFLLAENEKYNLTAVRDIDGVYRRHFFDSLAPVMTGLIGRDDELTVADVGTGAGLPGLPLLFVCPKLRVTFIDSTEKKCAFIRTFLAREGLDGSVVCGRAEELGCEAKLRGGFDLAVSRAVAALPALCELSLPLVRTGGRFIAYKGGRASEELAAAQTALATLGAAARIDPAPACDGEAAALIVCDKTADTPEKYPRAFGQIKKRPL